MKVLKPASPNDLFKVAEISLSYSNKNLSSRVKIIDSKSAYDVLISNWSSSIELVEEFNMLILDRANKVLGIQNISKGGFNATFVDLKVIFASALIAKASGIIVAHNHPTQGLRPSKADIQITKKIKEVGELLDLPLLDHIIVTSQNGFFSFADEGVL